MTYGIFGDERSLHPPLSSDMSTEVISLFFILQNGRSSIRVKLVTDKSNTDSIDSMIKMRSFL